MPASTAEVNILIRARDQAQAVIRQSGISWDNLGKQIRRASVVGAAAMAGLGIAAYKVGADFEKAYATIRTDTGATGAALEGLKADFKATLGTVPNDFNAVATATADLNTRLRLTGEPLQTMSKQFLDLARITKTDVATAIAAGTRVFGDWSIASKDQGDALDYVFKVSQNTGIGVDSLMQKVVAYGAPLRQFGFSFEEAAALMGKWEKEGVNTEAILGALKIGVANFAKEGIPMREGLQNLITDLQTLGPGADATRRAIEVFGSRAGPDMAAAITEGRFALDDLMGVVNASGETIASAAEDALTMGDKFSMLKNRVLVALEPVIMRTFGALERALDRVMPVIEREVPRAVAKMERAWEDIRPTVEGFVRSFRTGLETTWPILRGFVQFILDHKPLLIAAIAAIGAAIVIAFGPGAVAIAAIVGLITVIGYLRDHWQEISDAIVGKLTWLRDKFFGIITGLKNWLADNWREIVTVALAILFPPGAGLFALSTNAFGIRDKVVGAFTAIPGLLRNVAQEFFDAASELGGKLKEGLLEGLKAVGGFIANLATEVTNAIIEVINIGIRAINDMIPNEIDLLPKLPGGTIGLPDNPIPEIQPLARGGIVTRPTLALLAERGQPEAVIPLGRARGFGAGGGLVTVNLHIHGGFFGTELDARRMGRIIGERIQRDLRRL